MALAAGDTKAVCRALRARPAWDKVGDLAASHQVDALCWWMWRHVVAAESGVPAVDLPPALLDRLRLAYLHHLLRNQALENDLAVLQEALAARGVAALYLKGPWVAFCAYPDPGTRPVGDIDLCVREADYGAAAAALVAAGWRPRGSLPRTPSEALLRSHYRQQLRFAARGRRPVELHFRLVNMGPPEEERWVWESARELRVGSCSLRVPGPEAMLLHLLIHANQHGFAILRLLHDVRWALERDRPKPDAEGIRRRSEVLRCRACCYHALALAAELAGTVVESPMLDALRPPAARRTLFTLVWQLAAVRRLEAPRRRMELEAPRFYLLEMGRLRDKALFLARAIIAAGRAARSGRRVRSRSLLEPRGEKRGRGLRVPERPGLRQDLILRPAGREAAVYDPLSDRTALLNRSAAAVLDLCDGTRTAREIARRVAAVFAEGERDLLPDVEAVLNDFLERGFLAPVSAPADRRA